MGVAKLLPASKYILSAYFHILIKIIAVYHNNFMGDILRY
jgi:hypothetical protein